MAEFILGIVWSFLYSGWLSLLVHFFQHILKIITMATKKNMPVKEDAAENERRPVREGQEDSSVLSDKHPPDDKKYPHSTENDKQVQQQPEFIESNGSRKQDDEA
jgi:hypothetical protein